MKFELSYPRNSNLSLYSG